MGSLLSVIKTLIVPAVISMVLFVSTTYVFLPMWRRYRSSRYSQYLPLESISARTSSLRARVQHGIVKMFMPSSWSRTRRIVVDGRDGDLDDDSDSDFGEELGTVHEQTRREGRRIDGSTVDDARRLSRDLEEGFRDDSDEEEDDTEDDRRR